MNKDAFLNQWRSNSLRSVLVARGTALHAPIKMPFTHCSKPKAAGHGSPAYKCISNSRRRWCRQYPQKLSIGETTTRAR
jgi:hypothetical protein